MAWIRDFLKKPLLPLSLGLNLFFLGVVASDLLTRPALTWPDHSSESIAAAIVKILPDPDGKLLQAAIESRHQDLQKARRDYLAAYIRLHNTIWPIIAWMNNAIAKPAAMTTKPILSAVKLP